MKTIANIAMVVCAAVLLSGCTITKFTATERGNAGRELLDLHEAHEKKIIGDAEYQRLKTKILERSKDSINKKRKGSSKDMVHVIAFIKVKPEHREELIKIFNANVPNVLAEDGCIQYTLTTDTDSGIGIQQRDETILTVIEKWESLEALQAHLEAPHMDQYRQDTEGMTEGVELRVLQDT
ncbi:putative quinol monooxygenase YgiN [Pontiella desulfatans]|uniref:Putative quinol monooxygenase YgiN n=1 Tax=Pontiella desulfatans TaxID=2750659 RepID=A0A6C2TVL7_PONDE|nr:putative quinol monooxygenase [Pontiella desulfatans]VGO11534.1 putative quinol monooxygenase YgiN [Pontiella desulfatans]